MSTGPTRTPKLTWKSIAISVGVIVVLLAIVCVTGLAIAFHQHTSAATVPRETAERLFNQERTRFGDATPMVTMGSHGAAVVHRPPATAPLHELHTLHVMLYDPPTGKLVRTDVPAWLLELVSMGGHLRLTNLSLGGTGGLLTLDDLRRFGPGLILNYQDSNDSRMLVWTN